MSKTLKQSVDYTDHAKVMNERCGLCKHIIFGSAGDTDKCRIVMGDISRGGWCKRFNRR